MSARLAISNIAWNLADDALVADLMVEASVRGVEIAPTKVWPKPLLASARELADYRRFWESRGIPIVAMQALLFGRADLTLFESREKREETLAYLDAIMKLAGALGAGPLVFGSPKNRKVGAMAKSDAATIAVDFFRRAGDAAVKHGVVLCIEPNPTQYECDWVTTAREGIELVAAVNHPGFRLHLDAAGMTLAGDPIEESLRAAAASLCHFHVSEPFLGPIGKGGKDGVRHDLLAATLKRIGYAGFTSVEMRFDPAADLATELRRVLRLLRETYAAA
jgi:D-psicose/D-tagatose/L-ribulose 3-epimerase